MNLREVDLGRLNTATKYPSIATYHTLGPRGILTDEIPGLDLDSGKTVYVREKVDGSNARLMMFGDQWIIGSREELFCANGDLVFNPSQRIVEALRPVAERMLARQADRYAVYYFEVYGGENGQIGRNGKQYSSDGSVGYRLFDILIPDNPWFEIMLRDVDRETIAGWRDTNHDKFAAYFADQDRLKTLADLDDLPLVPDLGHGPMRELPRTIEATREWMAGLIPATRAHLGDGTGAAEGLIIRTDSSSAPRRDEMRKLRFESYDRTLKARTQ